MKYDTIFLCVTLVSFLRPYFGANRAINIVNCADPPEIDTTGTVTVSVSDSDADDNVGDRDVNCYSRRQASGLGFYRDLSTIIDFKIKQPIHEQTNCRLSLVEFIPTGLYVDMDEMARRADHSEMTMYSAEPIDIEKPEYLSAAHIVYVYSKHTVSLPHITVSYPIHLRYHRPQDGVHIANVTLQTPDVLLRCPFDVTQSETVNIPCDSNSSTLCSWQKLQCQFGDAGEVLFHVPVGKIEHVTFVITVTLLSTSVAITIMIYSIAINSTDRKTKHS